VDFVNELTPKLHIRKFSIVNCSLSSLCGFRDIPDITIDSCPGTSSTIFDLGNNDFN
jgi:hypothetical protein